MRCRKVRFLLSAACSDELDVRQQASLRDHLASCPSCRREASYYTSLRQAVGEIPRRAVSEDFNTRLLNRLAQERFHETRTRAYLPHRAPRFSWRILAPVAVTAALGLVAVTSFYSGHFRDVTGTPGAQWVEPMDDRYLTAQPTNNPRMSMDMANDWSLHSQLARAARLDSISRELTNRYGFSNVHMAGSRTYRGNMYLGLPQMYPGQPPVFRVYRVGGSREAGQAY